MMGIESPAGDGGPPLRSDSRSPGNGAADYVLVVDDNALNAKLLRLALEAQGRTVRIADCAQAAANALREALPAVMLLDVQLPDVDGLTFLRALRADHAKPRVPVIVVSAFAAGTDLERAYDAGADAFMPKPVNVKALMQMVQRFTATSSSIDENTSE